jgi:hypothetical protein
MLNRPDNDELNLLAVKAKQGDLLSREVLAERLFPVAMVISRRFFQEWSTEHLTRRELAQECCMAFFDKGLRNYKPGKGDVMAYFAGLCVWVGCKARQAGMAGRRGGMIKGVHCRMVRVDGLTGTDDDAWESIGIETLDSKNLEAVSKKAVNRVEEYVAKTKLFKKHGITVAANLMFGFDETAGLNTAALMP